MASAWAALDGAAGGTRRFSKCLRESSRACTGGTSAPFYGDVFRGGAVAQRYKELLRLRALHPCTVAAFVTRAIGGTRWQAGLTEAQIAAFDDHRESGTFTRGRAGGAGAGELSWRSPNSTGALSPSA